MKTNHIICHKLGRCGNYKKILAGLFVCVSLIFTACTAFAAGSTLEEGGLSSPMGQLFGFLKTIALPIGVLGIGSCVFSFFLSDEKGYAIAKKRMLHIGAAVACLFLIPLVVSFVFNSNFQSMAWNPDGNNMKIVQEAPSNFEVPEFTGKSDSSSEGDENNSGEDGEN